MGELILKDIWAMGKALKVYTLFLNGYLALALMRLFELEIAVAMIHVVIVLFPLGTFTYDAEFTLTRAKIGARYLLVLLAALFSATAGFLSSVLLLKTEIWAEHLRVVLVSLGTGLLAADFALPVCCKMKQWSAQPNVCFAISLPVVVLFAVFRLRLLEEGPLGLFGPAQSWWGILCFLLLALAGFGVSFLLSSRMAEKRVGL